MYKIKGQNASQFFLRLLLNVFQCCLILIFCCNCKENKEVGQFELSQEELISMGKVLSESQCSSCHLYPEPHMLDKQTWKTSVLPAMKEYAFPQVENESSWYSWILKTPIVSQQNEYESIVAFYNSHAPSNLEIPSYPAPTPGIPGFSIDKPVFDKKLPSLTTFIDYDSVSNLIWVGDRMNKLFGIEPNNYSIEMQVDLLSTPVQIIPIDSSQLNILTMGNMDPSDLYEGKLLRLDLTTNKQTVILDSLNRPVHIKSFPNQYGDNQWILSEFGNLEGGLNLRTSTSSQELIKQPGCRKSIQVDWDNDGDMDFIAGFGQAKEAIYWIENRGEGKFLNHILEQFQPSFGLSDLAIQDVNQDGFPDIILINGDNADLSPILKPYHGVRIYFGAGNNQLELNWFYHISGAMSLVAEDFDQDGNIEMAVVSYFADFRNENRLDWLYFDELESESKKIYNLPVPLKGRWLTIAAGDVDQDGDLDLLTGSFMFQPGINYDTEMDYWSENWEPFFILRNHVK